MVLRHAKAILDYLPNSRLPPKPLWTINAAFVAGLPNYRVLGFNTRYVSFPYTPLVQAWKCLIFYDQCVNALCLPLGVFLRILQYSSFPSMPQRTIPVTHGMKTRYHTCSHLTTSFSFRTKSATPYFVLSRSAVSFLNSFTYGRVSGCPGIYYILLANYPRINPLNVEIPKNTFRSTSGTTIPSSVW